ncbi:unnamed protein product [Cladocopium goreaui]|uniref:Uncharacterized protein n=1 Tax=Cladocopium goreaui TaxID=2562237 RepID=A0A9P1CHV4_9DINO|nr:unnamed protein product [Cladocopium goreaui]
MALRPLWTGSPAASPNAAVAGDHVESQPVEIMKVPVPSDPLPTSSPDIPSKLRREKYQGERKAEFEKEVATPAAVPAAAPPTEEDPGKVEMKSDDNNGDMKDGTKDAMNDDLGFVTRDDQLKFKSTKKRTRRTKTAVKSKRKNKKGKTNKTSKTPKSKKNAPKEPEEPEEGSQEEAKNKKPPTRIAVGRKRKVLTSPQKRCKIKSASSAPDKKPQCFGPGHDDTPAPPAPPAPAKRGKAPMAKAKAKAKTKATCKAAASPKAKNTRKKQVKEAPEGEATPKKTRGRKAVRNTGDDYWEEQKTSPLFSAEMVKELEEFALRFDTSLEVKSTKFKEFCSAQQDKELWHHRLNRYWTRMTCGVTLKETGKDVLHFGFTSSCACDVHKMAISVKCAMISAVGLENKEPYERDGLLNEKLKHNAALALFLLANRV